MDTHSRVDDEPACSPAYKECLVLRDVTIYDIGDRRRGARDRRAAPDLIPAALGCAPNPQRSVRPEARTRRQIVISIAAFMSQYEALSAEPEPVPVQIERWSNCERRQDPNPLPWPWPPRAFLQLLPVRHCQPGQRCRPIRKRELRGVQRPPRPSRILASRASHLRRCVQAISREAACRGSPPDSDPLQGAHRNLPNRHSPSPSTLTCERAPAVARRAARSEFRSRVREAVRSRVRVQIRERRHRVRGRRRTQLAVHLEWDAERY